MRSGSKLDEIIRRFNPYSNIFILTIISAIVVSYSLSWIVETVTPDPDTIISFYVTHPLALIFWTGVPFIAGYLGNKNVDYNKESLTGTILHRFITGLLFMPVFIFFLGFVSIIFLQHTPSLPDDSEGLFRGLILSTVFFPFGALINAYKRGSLFEPFFISSSD